MSPSFSNLFVFLIGLCIGSFLNVSIHRWPLGKSIVRPPSACPACGAPIRWYDNIPILSYIMLRGRCRDCNAPIGARYPLVELLTGLLAMATWMRYGPGLPALIYFGLIAALIVISFIDYDHRIIPDFITLPGIPIGFIATFGLPAVTWNSSLIGIAVGGGSLMAIAIGYRLLSGKNGMGGGDIKLLAMIGGFLGWQGVLFTIMTSSFLGTLVGIGVALHSGGGMKMAVPFGPFLAIGAIVYLFFGSRIIRWYFGWL